MRKNVNVVAGLFFLYVIACWPLLVRYCYSPFILWCVNDARVCMIVSYLMAVTLICTFFSMMAMVLKCYRVAFFIALIPIFVESVLLCSILLVFLFHRELTAALAMSKLRAAGHAIISVIKAPYTLLKYLVRH